MTEDDGINDEQSQPNKRPRLESEPQPQERQYWPNIPEARQVFKPISADCNRRRRTAAGGNSVTTSTLILETAKKVPGRRIQGLQLVHVDKQGWRNVVMGRDSNNYSTMLDIFEIWKRSIILCCTYKIALTSMNRMSSARMLAECWIVWASSRLLTSFDSSEFGFGRKLTEAELEKINCKRQGVDKSYTDTIAAMEILNTTKKPLLVEWPFEKYLYIGANKNGFWDSVHMNLQCEDIIDCVQVLYPEYELKFFDHSQGHGRAHSVHNKCHGNLEERNQSWETQSFLMHKDISVPTYLACWKLAKHNHLFSRLMIVCRGACLLSNETCNDTAKQQDVASLLNDQRGSFSKHWQTLAIISAEPKSY